MSPGKEVDMSALYRRLLVASSVRSEEGQTLVEFGLILALVSTTMALAQARTVESLEQSGVAVGIATMASNVVSLGALVLPLLLLIGMNIADFTRRAAGWAADIATDRFPAWLVRVVLGVVALWRLSAVLGDLVAAIGRSSLQATLPGYLGAALIPLGVWGVWFLAMRLRRRAQDDPLTSDDIAEAAEATTPKLVLAYVGVPMLTIILLDVGLALLAVPGQTRSAQVNAMIAVVNVFRDQSDTWQAILQAAMLLAVIPLAYRGRDDLALYLGAFGARGVWLWLTGTNRPLAALGWTSPQPVELWWVLTFVGFGLVWLWRRRLTTERAGRLIYLLLITYLLGQTDFISNPFSPFFSFAGIGFVAFGIVWDAVTIGSWANHESPGLPRISRIFLYLGYVLVTVALINWVLTAHDLKELDRFTGQTALSGLNLFGKPLLYAIFAATLMLPARTEAGTATGDTD
jgi:Flp pilus assembly pilin Flp